MLTKVLLVTASLVLLAGGGAAAFLAHWREAPLPVSNRSVVVLQPGEPFAGFARRLHGRGIVAHPRWLTLIARVSGQARRAQAGEYEINPGDTPAGLLAKLVSGDVLTYEVKIVEGWTAMQAVSVLDSQPALQRTLDGVSVHTLLEVLGLPAGNAEGLFFPDTYHYVRGTAMATSCAGHTPGCRTCWGGRGPTGTPVCPTPRPTRR